MIAPKNPPKIPGDRTPIGFTDGPLVDAAQPRQHWFLHKVSEKFFAAMPLDVRIGFAIPQAFRLFPSELCPKAIKNGHSPEEKEPSPGQSETERTSVGAAAETMI